MRLGKRERLSLKERDALTRARKIKASLVEDDGARYYGAHSLANIMANGACQYKHSQVKDWSFNQKHDTRIKNNVR